MSAPDKVGKQNRGGSFDTHHHRIGERIEAAIFILELLSPWHEFPVEFVLKAASQVGGVSDQAEQRLGAPHDPHIGLGSLIIISHCRRFSVQIRALRPTWRALDPAQDRIRVRHLDPH